MYTDTFKEKFSKEGVCKPVKEHKDGKKRELILLLWQPLELPGGWREALEKKMAYIIGFHGDDYWCHHQSITTSQ